MGDLVRFTAISPTRDTNTWTVNGMNCIVHCFVADGCILVGDMCSLLRRCSDIIYVTVSVQTAIMGQLEKWL